LSKKQNIDYQKIYNKELKKVENKISLLFKNKKPVSLYNPSKYIMKSGGKRLRPLLVLFTAKALGGEYSQVYNAALSVELIHNFTLAHDDIMDNAAKRRGRKTLHKEYDINTAILTGDNMVPIAYELLLKDIHAENSQAIIKSFSEGIREVCEGQSLDEEFELRDNVTIREYKKMIGKKTAALLKTCCSVGAQIVSSDKGQIKNLEKFGYNLGMAFQLNDDFLDLFADEAKFGKVIGGYLIEGKKTYLFLTALELAEGKYKREILKIIKDKGIRKTEVQKYKEMFVKLGVVEKTKTEIRKYSLKAISNLNSLTIKDNIEGLLWLTNSLIDRNN